MLKQCLIVLFLLSAVSACWADTSLEKAILAKEASFRECMLKSDHKTLADMLGEDLHAVFPDGTAVDKAGHQKIWANGDWKVTKADATELKVRTYNDDTAIVTGHLDFEGTWKGKKVDLPRMFTHVWVKEGKEWKMVSRHLSTFEK